MYRENCSQNIIIKHFLNWMYRKRNVTLLKLERTGFRVGMWLRQKRRNKLVFFYEFVVFNIHKFLFLQSPGLRSFSFITEFICFPFEGYSSSLSFGSYSSLDISHLPIENLSKIVNKQIMQSNSLLDMKTVTNSLINKINSILNSSY